MESTNIHLSKPIDCQLENAQVKFNEVPKEKFFHVQNVSKRLSCLIYRTMDKELPNGDSEVTFYSLCYIKASPNTTYFVSEISFVVPPWRFLGDNEEREIINWLKKDRASFLKRRRSTHQTKEWKPLRRTRPDTLTEIEEREVEECTKLFLELENENDAEMDLDTFDNFPNFSLGFDFLNPEKNDVK